MKLKNIITIIFAITLSLFFTGCLSFPNSRYRITKVYDIGNFVAINVAAPVKIIMIRNFIGTESRFAVKYKNCRVDFDAYNCWTLTISGMFEKAFLETLNFQDKKIDSPALKLYCDVYDFSVDENNIFTIDIGLTFQYENNERKLRKVVTAKAQEFEAKDVAVAAQKCMKELMKYSANEINNFVKGVNK